MENTDPFKCDECPSEWPEEHYRFVAELAGAGIPTEHYHGKWYWRGPAARTDEHNGPKFQDVIRATTVEVQWDDLALDKIVYPVA